MMKLTMPQKRLLFEAYRRNDMAVESHADWQLKKPLDQRWLGLGSRAAYRSVLDAGLMVFHDGQNPPPRVSGWLVLTSWGVTALFECENEFKQALSDLKRNFDYQRSLRSQYNLAGEIKA
jgi:hypothetical protein